MYGSDMQVHVSLGVLGQTGSDQSQKQFRNRPCLLGQILKPNQDR